MNLSKSLKNRIVGILVLLSIVLIFIPALMSRENTDPAQSNVQSIAITIPPLGAVILRGAGEYKKPKAKKSKAREELPA